MPGIFATIALKPDPASLERALNRACTIQGMQANSFQGEHVIGQILHLGSFNHQLVFQHPALPVGLVLDGWIFEAPGMKAGQDAAAYCVHAYLDRGIDFLKHLNGQFNLVLWDDRTHDVFFANDRYATRPLFYLEKEDVLYLAPEGKSLLAAAQRPPVLNENMLVNQLAFSRLWIGDNTYFKDVRAVMSGTLWHWRDGRIGKERYWSYSYDPVARVDSEFIETCATVFRESVESHIDPSWRLGMTLSGGLDSRTTLSALSPAHQARCMSFTWGVGRDYDEVEIASQASAHRGVDWEWVPLTPLNCIENAKQGIRKTEGMDLFMQSFGLSIFPAIAARTDVMLNGVALDLLAGGSHLSEALIDRPLDLEAGFAYLLNKLAYTPIHINQLFSWNGAVDAMMDLWKELYEAYFHSQNPFAPDRIDEIFMRFRLGRNLFVRQRWQTMFVENIYSIYDNRFMDMLLRIPLSARRDYAFYQSFLKCLDPGALEIPYNNTGMPATVPVEFWSAGTRLEQRREQLYRDVYRATNGKTFIPYTHYYSNFDEWLRMDPDWIALTDDLLLSADSMLCQRFLDRELVAEMVQEHREAKVSRYGKLIQMMTIELTLREFFG